MTSTTSTTAAPVETAEEWAAKIAGLRAEAPRETWLTVPNDKLVVEVDQARVELYGARQAARRAVPAESSVEETNAFLDDDPGVKAARAELERRIEAAQAAEVTFHFRALPSDVYDKLTLEFPPTDEQVAHGIGYDVEKWVPALIARSSVKPLTEEQVAGLIYPRTETVDGAEVEIPPVFSQGDVTALVQSCRDLNEKPRLMLGKGSRPTGG
jgi:hypothetical protein